MKRFSSILLFTTLCFFCQPILAQASKGEGDNRINVSTRVAIGDYWGENWNQKDNKIHTSINKNKFIITLYPRSEEVWNYYCRITVQDFVLPDKKERKEHVKNGTDYLYKCNVEFFYNVKYPSLEECFANYGGFVVNSKDTEAKKRTVEGVLRLNSMFFSLGEKFKDGDWMLARLLLEEVGIDMYFMNLLYFDK